MLEHSSYIIPMIAHDIYISLLCMLIYGSLASTGMLELVFLVSLLASFSICILGTRYVTRWRFRLAMKTNFLLKIHVLYRWISLLLCSRSRYVFFLLSHFLLPLWTRDQCWGSFCVKTLCLTYVRVPNRVPFR